MQENKTGLMDKRLMKIDSAYVGFGGYQDAMIGIWLSFSGSECGVSDCNNGTWATWNKHCKWTKESQVEYLGNLMLKIAGWLKEAKIDSVDKLKGIPVEVTFEGNALQSWRILTEVL
jgi:hypothetical protein